MPIFGAAPSRPRWAISRQRNPNRTPPSRGKRILSTIYKGSHNTFTIGKLTFLRPDVAVVDIDGILTGFTRLPPGLKAAADGSMHVKLQEVMTRERGQWQIAAFHNVAVTPLPPAQ